MSRYIVYKMCSTFHHIRHRMAEEGLPVPKGYFLTEQEAILDYEIKLKTAEQKYLKGKPIAMDTIDKIEQEIKEVLKKYGAELSFHYDGDSQGIDNERIEIEYKGYSKEVDF